MIDAARMQELEKYLHGRNLGRVSGELMGEIDRMQDEVADMKEQLVKDEMAWWPHDLLSEQSVLLALICWPEETRPAVWAWLSVHLDGHDFHLESHRKIFLRCRWGQVDALVGMLSCEEDRGVICDLFEADLPWRWTWRRDAGRLRMLRLRRAESLMAVVMMAEASREGGRPVERLGPMLEQYRKIEVLR